MTPPRDDPTDEEAEEKHAEEGAAEEYTGQDDVVQGDREVPPDEEGPPLADLREEVERRRERRGEDRTVEDVFEEMSDDEVVEGEAVWAELLEVEDAATATEEIAAGEPVDDAPGDRDVRIIPNRICHSCEYFGDPPELHCEHDGTDIERVVDMEHYEVVDCPMVRDRDELE